LAERHEPDGPYGAASPRYHFGPRANAIPMKGISAVWVPLVVLLSIIEEPRSLAVWLGLLACGLVVAVALAWRGWPSWVVWVVRGVFVICAGLFLLAHQFFLIGIVAVVLGLVVAVFVNSRNLEDQRSRASWRKTQ
jgi:hypothetical protein